MREIYLLTYELVNNYAHCLISFTLYGVLIVTFRDQYLPGISLH